MPPDHIPQRHTIRFRQLRTPYAIIRQPPDAALPAWAMHGNFTSITRTAEELSIVCPSENVPQETAPSLRWTCFQLEGPFPFSQTGVLRSFIEPLSDNGVPIFAISTYDTDYVLVQEDFRGVAIECLRTAGHLLILVADPTPV